MTTITAVPGQHLLFSHCTLITSPSFFQLTSIRAPCLYIYQYQMLPREGCPPGRMRCPGDIGAFPPGPRASSLSMSNSPAKPSRARCLRSLEIEAMLAFLVWAFSFSRSACTCLEYFLASRCFRLRAAESCQRTSGDLAASDDAALHSRPISDATTVEASLHCQVCTGNWRSQP